MQSHEKFASYRKVTGIMVALDKQGFCETVYRFFFLKAHLTQSPRSHAAARGVVFLPL
jgi:hypothetical protein